MYKRQILKMPARKIKVVDVINAIEDHAVDPPVSNDTAIENEPNEPNEPNQPNEPIPSEVEVEEETTHPKPEVQTPVSNVKTVELVECPDCGKKHDNENIEVLS